MKNLLALLVFASPLFAHADLVCNAPINLGFSVHMRYSPEHGTVFVEGVGLRTDNRATYAVKNVADLGTSKWLTLSKVDDTSTWKNMPGLLSLQLKADSMTVLGLSFLQVGAVQFATSQCEQAK